MNAFVEMFEGNLKAHQVVEKGKQELWRMVFGIVIGISCTILPPESIDQNKESADPNESEDSIKSLGDYKEILRTLGGNEIPFLNSLIDISVACLQIKGLRPNIGKSFVAFRTALKSFKSLFDKNGDQEFLDALEQYIGLHIDISFIHDMMDSPDDSTQYQEDFKEQVEELKIKIEDLKDNRRSKTEQKEFSVHKSELYVIPQELFSSNDDGNLGVLKSKTGLRRTFKVQPMLEKDSAIEVLIRTFKDLVSFLMSWDGNCVVPCYVSAVTTSSPSSSGRVSAVTTSSPTLSSGRDYSSTLESEPHDATLSDPESESDGDFDYFVNNNSNDDDDFEAVAPADSKNTGPAVINTKSKDFTLEQDLSILLGLRKVHALAKDRIDWGIVQKFCLLGKRKDDPTKKQEVQHLLGMDTRKIRDRAKNLCFVGLEAEVEAQKENRGSGKTNTNLKNMAKYHLEQRTVDLKVTYDYEGKKKTKVYTFSPGKPGHMATYKKRKHDEISE